MPTPTSNPALLDEGTLARLATEMLRSLPGARAQPQVPALPPITSGLPDSVVAGSLPPLEPSPLSHTTPLNLPLPHVGQAFSLTPQDAPKSYASQDYATRPPLASSPSTPSVPLAQPAQAELHQPATALATVPSVATTLPNFYFLDQPRPDTFAKPPHQAVRQEPTLSAPGASAQEGGQTGPVDLRGVRRDFPILSERVNGRPLIWFDNAATTQKPQVVIDRLATFYAHENSNIHRAAHTLAARATDAYEAARDTVRNFLGASSSEEIIFVRGATEGINLVAQSWGAANISTGDEILISHLEHHANIVPWQQLAAVKGAKIKVIPVDDEGQIRLDAYRQLLNDKVRLVAISQVSNALGTITPVEEIVALAHAAGARVLVDGAQSVSHLAVNVRALDADFFVFSGHKIFGPTGIGAVYAKREWLEHMPPWQGGGNMIADVTFEHTVYQKPPARFEAGTGNIADAAGLGAALDYVSRIGLPGIAAWEHHLLGYATEGLRSIPGVRLIGTAAHKASVASFVLKGYSTEEVGRALNEEGIAVRTGHHCAQPILRRFGVETTVRPSFAFYNTTEEIDCMLAVLRRLAGKGR